jgi:osmotically-inducible protein OsmY
MISVKQGMMVKQGSQWLLRAGLVMGLVAGVGLMTGCIPLVAAGGTSAGMGLASNRGLGAKIDDDACRRRSAASCIGAMLTCSTMST